MDLIRISGIYALVLNVSGFVIAGYDKKKARTGGSRVPEKTLLLLALMGGAVGVYLGMIHFRHKTRHLLFVYGIPILILLNLVTFYFLMKD